ncbi:MFS transporter [Tardisphaera miroshnichenkoae]
MKTSRFFAFYLAFLGDFVLGVEFVALPIKGYLLGANSFEIGLLGGASSAIYSFMPLLAGKIGDKSGTKLPVTFFLFTYPVITAVYFASRSLDVLIAARVLEGLEWPFYWPSLESTVAISGGRKGLKYYNLSWGIGALAGPFAGGALVYALGASRTFGVITILTLATAILSVFSFEGRKEDKKSEKKERVKLELIYLIAAFGYGFAGTGFLSYFPVTAYRLNVSSVYVGTYEALMGLLRLAAMVGAGAMLERLTSKTARLLPLGVLAAFLAPLGLLCGSAFWAISPALLGLFLGLAYAMSIHGVLESEGSRGTKAGVFESAIGAGSFVGPVIMGFFASYLLRSIYSAYVAMALSGLVIAAIAFLTSKVKLSI